MKKVSVYGTDRSIEPFDNDVRGDFKFQTEAELQAFLKGVKLGKRSSSLTVKEENGKERVWEL